MMKAETLLPIPMDIEFQNQNRREQIWLTAGQYEVLEIVARVLDQTISEYLTETVLSMLECELEDTIVSCKLRKKLGKSVQVQEKEEEEH